MEPSDLFWFLGIVAAYCRELADEGVPLAASLRVGAVLDDLCRLAGVPGPVEIEAVVSNLALLPAPVASVIIIG